MIEFPSGGCPDAVVVVPGSLGTELIDPDSGTVVWGLGAGPLARALGSGSLYEDMRNPRLKPGRLLANASSLPIFGRFEPYTDLVDSVRRVLRSPDALIEYPYDWRRRVRYLGAEFAVAAEEHLDRWRRHRLGSVDARLSLVAHSMGGLVCLEALTAPQGGLAATSVRQLITLGTPFLGSVKAVRAIATGEVLPGGWLIRERTKQRLRSFAIDTPSVYDLLPRYPSTYVAGGAHTTASLRRATTDDFADVGGRREFAELAADDHVRRIGTAPATEIWSMVGTSQATLQSFAMNSNGTEFFEDVGGYDWAGDGTVHFHSSYLPARTAGSGLPQTHGAIANSEEAQSAVITRLVSGNHPGLWQSGGGLGLLSADSAGRSQEFVIEARMPVNVVATCRWREAATGLSGVIRLGPPRHRVTGEPGNKLDVRYATHAWSQPGLYTITVAGGGSSAVSVDVLIEDET